MAASDLRLQMLLHGSGPTTPESVTQLLNEGARFNLAEGSRNFNLPTVALFFLHPETQSQFKWSRQSPASAATWVMTFKERGQPTIIHTEDGEPVFSQGLVEIETATGEVRRTELTVHIDKPRVRKGDPQQDDGDHPEVDYTLTTTFGRVASVNMNLPVSLNRKVRDVDRNHHGRSPLRHLPQVRHHRAARAVVAPRGQA